MNIRTKNVSTLMVLLAFGLGVASVHAASQVGLRLHDAAGDGDVDTVRSILATEAGRGQINRKWQSYKATPLLEAVRNGHEAVVRVLLEHGADVDVVNSNLETSLHIVAYEDHEAIASLLLDYGADTEVKNNFGKTPLYRAESHGNVARLLVRRGGADLDTLGYSIPRLEAFERERLRAVRVWASQLQEHCGLSEAVVNSIILNTMVLTTDGQRRRFKALARTPERSENPRSRKRARHL